MRIFVVLCFIWSTSLLGVNNGKPLSYTPDKVVSGCVEESKNDENDYSALEHCLSHCLNFNDQVWVMHQQLSLIPVNSLPLIEVQDSLQNRIIRILLNHDINPTLKADLLYKIGARQSKSQSYHQAAAFYEWSYKTSANQNDSTQVIRSSIKLLNTYHTLDYKDRITELNERSSSWLDGVSKHWQGYYYLSLFVASDDSIRIEYLKQAQQLLNLSNSRSKHILLFIYYGEYYLSQGQWNQAQKYLDKAKKELDYLQSNAKSKYTALMVLLEAPLIYQGGEADMAFQMLDNTIVESKKQGHYRFYLRSLKLKEKLAVDHKDFEVAYGVNQILDHLDDSTRRFNHIRQYDHLLVAQNTSFKEETIKELEVEMDNALDVAEQKKKNSSILIWLLALSLILLIGIIVLYIINLRVSKKLKNLNELKDHIFSALSHDLRSPMYSFNHLIELGQNSYISKDQFDEYLTELQTELVNTNNLIQGLLKWAHSNRNMLQVKVERLRLDQVLEEVTPLFRQELNRKKMKLNNFIDMPLEVYSDYDLIQFIFRNLISNAIKFSKEGKEITIRFEVQSNHVNVYVIDQGQGFTKRQIKDFYEGKLKSNLDVDGNKSIGIGLVLCRDFAMKLNHPISLKSDQGSSFRISLPLHL